MTWWSRLSRRNSLERDLGRELDFHIAERVSVLQSTGLSEEESRRRVYHEFGGMEQVKEACRDARGTRWLEDVMADIRYAFRTLRKVPTFTLVCLVTLALGIGVTTGIFTVLNGVLLKPLAYSDPGHLVNLQEKTTWETAWGDIWALSYPNYLDCKHRVHSLELAAMHNAGGAIVSAPGDAAYVDGLEISSNLFSVLGVHLLRGRPFSPDEDRPAGSPPAIIGFHFWQQRFGGNPQAIGMKLVYDGHPRTVIGIAPAGFRIDGEEVDLFTPIGQDTVPMQLNRERHGTVAWGRLRPGATLAHANAELAVIGHQLESAYPKSNHGRTFIAEILHADVGEARPTLWLLLGAVSLVLLIACANIASLLLARAVSRQRELALRAALGASRGRLVRQYLTESAVLGFGGGCVGVLFAIAVVRALVALWPNGLPRSYDIRVDERVLLFATGISLLSGLVCGLAPALRTRLGEIDRTLRAGARTIVGGTRHLHAAFVTVEVALAVVLLASAAMLGQTLLHLASLSPGLNIKNLMTARVALAPATLTNPAQTRANWKDLLDRARRVPGVDSVAMIDTVPMREGSNPIGYTTSAAAVPENQQPMVLANCTTPDYLKTMGIPLLRGRFLSDQDHVNSQSVAVVDDVMAKQAFPGEDPIGKQLWIGIARDPVTVVGVVGHVRQWGLAGDDNSRIRAQLYYPFSQVPDQLVRRWSELMSIAIRTETDPQAVLKSLRQAVSGATRDQVLYETHTMEQLVSQSLARQRFLLLLFGIFAGLALVLACVGVYGVFSYLTGQRIPEIGIRIALGANTGQVVALIMRQSCRMILAGIALGFAGAIAAARLLLWLIEGMQIIDPLTLILTVCTLMAAALFASFLPARRASRIDAMQALRQE
ncbi:MAG TPA: ABC transporter permease [Candidatus Sulfotelmatobacter sp.]|nr:ABC transporter permease [Candidatus Sulfotelmatobacter sp.]